MGCGGGGDGDVPGIAIGVVGELNGEHRHRCFRGDFGGLGIRDPHGDYPCRVVAERHRVEISQRTGARREAHQPRRCTWGAT